jgi:hypothetical protein
MRHKGKDYHCNKEYEIKEDGTIMVRQRKSAHYNNNELKTTSHMPFSLAQRNECRNNRNT